MQRYLLRRGVTVLLILFILSVVIFLLLRVMPGDVVGATASTEGGRALTGSEAKAARQRLGLDEPMHVQYLSWVGGILTRGDFGTSLYTRESLNSLLAKRAPVTLLLALYSVIVMVAVGLPLGILSALKPNTLLDSLARVTAVLGLAVPNFWLGILLIIGLVSVFNWSPPLGYSSPVQNPTEHLQKMLWPAMVAGFSYGAVVARMTRASMLEVLAEDYVRTARSKGLLGRQVVVRHALRNALLPVLTVISTQMAALMSGIVVLERVFAVPGMGTLLIEAVGNRDYVVVQSAILVVAAAVVLINLITDILYGYVDPRVRYG